MLLEHGMSAAVTGAASGIGRGLAEALAGRGLDLLLMDVAGPGLHQVGADLERAGVRVLAVETDVRDRSSVEAAAAAATSAFGRVDVVCNNAGVIGPYRPLWEQEEPDWRWIHEVNLMGVVHGIAAFVPAMVERGTGHVVNTASMNVLDPIPIGGNGPYAASKAGVLAITETLRTDLDRVAPGVGVTAMLPGPVASGIRDSERWRPADLAARTPGPTLPPVEFSYERLAADVAAERTLAAVEAGHLFVLPNAGSADAARARFERVLQHP